MATYYDTLALKEENTVRTYSEELIKEFGYNEMRYKVLPEGMLDFFKKNGITVEVMSKSDCYKELQSYLAD